MRDVLRRPITTGREIAWGVHAGHAIRHGVPVPGRGPSLTPATLTPAAEPGHAGRRTAGYSATRPASYPADPGELDGPATALCSWVR